MGTRNHRAFDKAKGFEIRPRRWVATRIFAWLGRFAGWPRILKSPSLEQKRGSPSPTSDCSRYASQDMDIVEPLKSDSETQPRYWTRPLRHGRLCSRSRSVWTCRPLRCGGLVDRTGGPISLLCSGRLIQSAITNDRSTCSAASFLRHLKFAEV